MSKGSLRRPTQINDKQADDNWNRIFGKNRLNHLLKDDIDGFTEESNHVRKETKRHRKETAK